MTFKWKYIVEHLTVSCLKAVFTSILPTDTIFFLRDCCTLWYSAADSVVLSAVGTELRWAGGIPTTLPLWWGARAVRCRAAFCAPSLQLSWGFWTWCSFASLPDIMGVVHGSEHPLPSHSPGTQMLVNITFWGEIKAREENWAYWGFTLLHEHRVMKVSSGPGPTKSYLWHWWVEFINTASILILWSGFMLFFDVFLLPLIPISWLHHASLAITSLLCDWNDKWGS